MLVELQFGASDYGSDMRPRCVFHSSMEMTNTSMFGIATDPSISRGGKIRRWHRKQTLDTGDSFSKRCMSLISDGGLEE